MAIKDSTRVLISEDEGLAEKVAELQKENTALREKNMKLKKVLAALLD